MHPGHSSTISLAAGNRKRVFTDPRFLPELAGIVTEGRIEASSEVPAAGADLNAAPSSRAVSSGGRFFSRKTLYSPVTTFQPLPGLKRSIWRTRTPVVGPRSFS